MTMFSAAATMRPCVRVLDRAVRATALHGALHGALLGAVLGVLLLARDLRAQGGTLSVSSVGVVFPTPTATDVANGFIDNPVSIAFTGILQDPGVSETVVGRVEICALAGTLGNGKALADLQWRPADLSLPFQSIVQGCDGAVSTTRTVGTFRLKKSGSSLNFSGGVLLRMTLRSGELATTYGVPLGFTLTTSKT